MAESKAVPTVRIISALIIIASIGCVLYGGRKCVKSSVLGIESDWSCKGRVEMDNWKEGKMRGQWFVVISSAIAGLYYLGFTALACCGRRTGKLEMFLSVFSVVICIVNGGLEVYYGIYSEDVLGAGIVNASMYIESYIAAAVGFFLVALTSFGDVIAVARGH